jgi:hypothetical protein
VLSVSLWSTSNFGLPAPSLFFIFHYSLFTFPLTTKRTKILHKVHKAILFFWLRSSDFQPIFHFSFFTFHFFITAEDAEQTQRTAKLLFASGFCLPASSPFFTFHFSLFTFHSPLHVSPIYRYTLQVLQKG